MHSTSYVVKFILIVSVVVALVLASMATLLQPIHERNEALANKRSILLAVNQFLDTPVGQLTDAEVIELFESRIEQVVVDMEGNSLSEEEVQKVGYTGGKAEHVSMARERRKPEPDRILPVFRYSAQDMILTIVAVRGSGLWDEIWGHVALMPDLNTIAGVAFGHQAETPGLGAEISDDPTFASQFEGTKLYDEDGNYQAVKVVKGSVTDEDHQVDGITGATVTNDGVTEMIKRGVRYYFPYFEKLETQ